MLVLILNNQHQKSSLLTAQQEKMNEWTSQLQAIKDQKNAADEHLRRNTTYSTTLYRNAQHNLYKSHQHDLDHMRSQHAQTYVI